MTWSTFVNATPASEFEAAIEALTLPQHETAPPTAETLEQFTAAKDAVLTLFHSGALGDPSQGYYGANLSGHAVPGHTTDDTFSGDVINLNVYRSTLAADAARDAETASTEMAADMVESGA